MASTGVSHATETSCSPSLTRYSFWVGLLVMTLFFRFSSTIAAKALGVFYHFQWALAIGTRETARKVLIP